MTSDPKPGTTLGFFFRGFQPEAVIENQASLALMKLQEVAPTDAKFLGTVEKSPDGFTARLDIYSKQGPFMADVTAADPWAAIDQVVENIDNQLNQWKRRRLTREENLGVRDPYLAPPSLEG